ncbi:MAG: hypothetical protein WCG25_04250 [bacterium]
MFEREIISNMNEYDFDVLEKKLLNLYDNEDLIPENIKSKLIIKYKIS